MHPAAGGSLDGLGHKCGVQAVFLGQGLYRQLEGHNVIGGLQGPSVFQINLMLAGGRLVMAGLNLHSHLFQIQTDLPAGAFPVVQGAQVKISSCVAWSGYGVPFLIGLKQEKLQLRSHIKDQPQVLDPAKGPLQHAPGISRERSAVRVVYIADQTGYLSVLGPPRARPQRYPDPARGIDPIPQYVQSQR